MGAEIPALLPQLGTSLLWEFGFVKNNLSKETLL